MTRRTCRGSTEVPAGSWCQSSTSGRVPSGSGLSSSSTSTPRGSGKSMAITFTPTSGRKSATPTRRPTPCSGCARNRLAAAVVAEATTTCEPRPTSKPLPDTLYRQRFSRPSSRGSEAWRMPSRGERTAVDDEHVPGHVRHQKNDPVRDVLGLAEVTGRQRLRSSPYEIAIRGMSGRVDDVRHDDVHADGRELQRQGLSETHHGRVHAARTEKPSGALAADVPDTRVLEPRSRNRATGSERVAGKRPATASGFGASHPFSAAC